MGYLKEVHGMTLLGKTPEGTCPKCAVKHSPEQPHNRDSLAYSPAGEDFLMCVEVENFQRAVAEYAAGFDVDEHIEMWIEAKRSGTNGVPSARELVHDAEAIDKMLDELADALAAA